MQIKALLLTPLLAAGFASAAPQKSTTFEAIALRSASKIHHEPLQAVKNHLALNVAKQGASCDAKSDNNAVFNLVGDELFLFRRSATPQQLYVDRSGMGQGVIGYTTGAQSPPRNSERKGWKIDKDGNLTFDGDDFLACPDSKKAGGSWRVWANVGIRSPADSKNCQRFSARVLKDTKPNSCEYTQQQ
ncbi:hypothetical protein FZEAL_7252 [Fusarium zealandicum]|uniref:Cell wall protein PhiA n=1 Tax=Fusarium zealandicum TaxID=1053134 RepID=A0A8H4XJ22_9HYPO|nr:hypothetical protein FZEAL_7252 [Fusarium zealandicum]